MIPHTIITSIEELAAIEFSNEPMAVDTETAGLYGKICLVQLYQASWDKVLLIHLPDEFTIATLMYKLGSLPKVIFQNASYDLSIVGRMNIKKPLPNLVDTLYLARLAFPKKSTFTLDACYSYALKFNPYAESGIDKKIMQKADWSKDITADMIEYACIDVFYLIDLYDIIKIKEGSNSYKIDINTLKDCLEWQDNGVPVCKKELKLVRAELEEQLENIDLPESLNINSWKQVRAHLDTDESNGHFLKVLNLKGNKDCGEIIKKRSIIKKLSFIKTYEGYEHNDYRVPGIFAPSARSGRLTCKRENLQQWMRVFKRLVQARPGKILIYSDFDGLEMRAIAARIGDPALMKILAEGLSPHDYVAEMVFGKGFTPEHRRIAKTMNFLLLYGGGIAMLQAALADQADLLVSFEQAKSYKQGWINLFWRIAEWHEAGFSAHRHKKIWRTPLGREYVGKLGMDQLNIQIQGMGAEVAKLGRLYAAKELTSLGLDENGIMCNFKHDDYLYEVDDDPIIIHEYCRIVGENMAKAWQKVCSMPDVTHEIPMPISVDAGYRLDTIDSTGSEYNFSMVG